MANTSSSLPVFATEKSTFDPILSVLFEKSSGPVKAPEISQTRGVKFGSRGEQLPKKTDYSTLDTTGNGDIGRQTETKSSTRKRKRDVTNDLEESYVNKLSKGRTRNTKNMIDRETVNDKTVNDTDSESQETSLHSPSDTEDSDLDTEDALSGHETKTQDIQKAALDRSSRTVFLGNVSTETIKSKGSKKKLLAHLSSFLPSLPKSDIPHRIESIRFRSIAFSVPGLPKRAAFAKRELMDSTTKSMNAYVVYSTYVAARKACEALNGTVILDRHLRVDSISHPSPIDHRRCVFVGNLDFVGESSAPEGMDGKKPKKNKAAADVEEGLWCAFNDHARVGSGEYVTNTMNPVEYVRVVRDRATRIGKGFAYVQFHDENSAEAALLLDGQKFPPLLPRPLRVTRAKRLNKKKGTSQRVATGDNPSESTLNGRATKLFGRAGVKNIKTKARINGTTPTVFEGYRASEGKSVDGFKVKTKSRGAKAKKRLGKPKNRSTRRAAAFQTVGGR